MPLDLNIRFWPGPIRRIREEQGINHRERRSAACLHTGQITKRVERGHPQRFNPKMFEKSHAGPENPAYAGLFRLF